MDKLMGPAMGIRLQVISSGSKVVELMTSESIKLPLYAREQ